MAVQSKQSQLVGWAVRVYGWHRETSSLQSRGIGQTYHQKISRRDGRYTARVKQSTIIILRG